MKKSDREIMEILEAYDLTRCPHSAADLAGCDPKTVARYVSARDDGADVTDQAKPASRDQVKTGHLSGLVHSRAPVQR